jgi:hypothetical protein
MCVRRKEGGNPARGCLHSLQSVQMRCNTGEPDPELRRFRDSRCTAARLRSSGPLWPALDRSYISTRRTAVEASNSARNPGRKAALSRRVRIMPGRPRISPERTSNRQTLIAIVWRLMSGRERHQGISRCSENHGWWSFHRIHQRLALRQPSVTRRARGRRSHALNQA